MEMIRLLSQGEWSETVEECRKNCSCDGAAEQVSGQGGEGCNKPEKRN